MSVGWASVWISAGTDTVWVISLWLTSNLLWVMFIFSELIFHGLMEDGFRKKEKSYPQLKPNSGFAFGTSLCTPLWIFLTFLHQGYLARRAELRSGFRSLPKGRGQPASTDLSDLVPVVHLLRLPNPFRGTASPFQANRIDGEEYAHNP